MKLFVVVFHFGFVLGDYFIFRWIQGTWAINFFYAVLRVFQDLPAFLLVIPNHITERKVSILLSPLSSILFSFRSTWKTLDQEKRNE